MLLKLHQHSKAPEVLEMGMEEFLDAKLKDHKLETLSCASLWGVEIYADATIVMDKYYWPVHRWVLCKQSKYFEQTFVGNSFGSDTNVIDLAGRFLASNLNGFLKFLYTHDEKDLAGILLMDVYDMANYFMIDHMRYQALNRIHNTLQSAALDRSWMRFRSVAIEILQAVSHGEVLETLVHVIARHASSIMRDTGTLMWEELEFSRPGIMDQIIRTRVAISVTPDSYTVDENGAIHLQL